MERTGREEPLSFKEKMGRLLADARTEKRQLEYRDIFRYFRPKELKEEELDRVLDILAENQVQILDGEDESEDSEAEIEEELTEKVVIDMELPFAAITEQFIEELEYMEPFGKGNTKPVFAARGVVMQHVKIIGKNKNVAKATAIDAAGNRMEAICFHDAQEFAKQCERNNGKMSITFYPGINEFRGERQIQIVITHYR